MAPIKTITNNIEVIANNNDNNIIWLEESHLLSQLSAIDPTTINQPD
jgi:hypothetical protein